MVYDEWHELLQYRVNNYPGSGYVLQLTVKWLPGMATDFRDIRFSDGLDSKLPYWVESYTKSVSAIVHIKLGKSPIVFLHYGNGSISNESNGSKVFPFFEDWSNGWDTSKWGTKPASATVSNGVCTLTTTSNVEVTCQSIASFDFGYTVVSRYNGILSGTTADCGVMFGTSTTNFSRCLIYSSSSSFVYQSRSGSNNSLPINFSLSRDTSYHTFQVKRISSSRVDFAVDSATGSITTSSYIPTGALNIMPAVWDAATLDIDYIYVKKYIATEPTATVVSGYHKLNLNPQLFKTERVSQLYIPESSINTHTEFNSHFAPFPKYSSINSSDVCGDWSNVVKYRINNYPGSGYVCSFTIKWKPGMAADFRDIRFSDGSTKLSYWIESYTKSVSAIVHVKLGSSSAISLHYGNSNVVSESNGNNVFLLFDDFSDSVLDTTKWETGSFAEENNKAFATAGTGFDTPDVYNGKLRFSGTRTSSTSVTEDGTSCSWIGTSVRSKNGINDSNFVTVARTYFEQSSTSGYCKPRIIGVGQDKDNTICGYGTGAVSYVNAVYLAREISGTRSTGSTAVGTYPGTNWENTKFTFIDNGTCVYSGSGVSASYAVSKSFTTRKVFIGFNHNAPSATVTQYVDWIYVKKYVATEPTATIISDYRKSMPVRLLYSIENNPSMLLPKSKIRAHSEFNSHFAQIPKYQNPYSRWHTVDKYNVNNYPGSGYTCTFTVKWKPGMSTDFRDIRFSDGNVKLPYWIESFTKSTSAVVHVRLGSLPKLYLHYGNGTAVSESNGDKVFDFFDDFLGTSLDTTKWGTDTSYASVSGSKLYMTGTGAQWGWKWIKSLKGFTLPCVVASKCQFEGRSTAIGGSIGIRSSDRSSFVDILYYDSSTQIRHSGGSLTSNVDATEHKYMMKAAINGGSQSDFFRDGVKMTNSPVTGSIFTGQTWYLDLTSTGPTGYRFIADWVYVKKYTATEPTLIYVSTYYEYHTAAEFYRYPIFYNRESGLSIPLIKDDSEMVIPSGAYVPEINEISSRQRLSSKRYPATFIADVKGKGERHGAYHREAGAYSLEINDYSRRGRQIFCIAGMYLPIFESDSHYNIGRPSAIYADLVNLKGSRKELHSHRQPATYAADINEKGKPKLHSKRYPASFVDTIKENYDRHIHLHQRYGMYPSADFKEKGERRLHSRRKSDDYVDALKSDIRQKNIDFHRKAYMGDPVKEGVHRNVHSGRESASYVAESWEGSIRKFDIYRYYYNEGCYIPEPACKAVAIRHAKVKSGMSVGNPTVLLERYYWGVKARREGKLNIPDQNLLTEWEGGWNRDAQSEIPSLNVLVSPNNGRDALLTVSSIWSKASRQIDNYMQARMYLPEIALSARSGSVLYRNSALETSPILSSVTRKGTFKRTSGSSVVILGTDGIGEGLIGRIAELYLNDLNVSAERILKSVRDSALDMPENCLIAFGATNADRPFAPFDIDVEKSDYYVIVDKPEYSLELTKDLYYAVVRDGESMIEITQFDTDTFYASLKDTDPVTGELRNMPLSGKTVKAILKGGAPDTSVTADCIIVEDGKVKLNLKSSDTAISGKYLLRFVVLGEGYRKEVPESRDEYQEIQINDASYIEL